MPVYIGKNGEWTFGWMTPMPDTKTTEDSYQVEFAPLGGILGPLKSELGVFWLDFGSFFA